MSEHPAVEVLAGLVLEDGRTWGEAAYPWQWEDAEAIIGGEQRRHYLLRARGMSKSTDAAGVLIALMLTEAPPGSRSYVYATDADQAEKLADALAGLVDRSGLGLHMAVGARTITVKSSGASLSIETSDGASAFGSRPWLSVSDELGAWPSTANHRRLWSAIVSAVPKVPGSRLIVLSTAGSPMGLGAEVWGQAEQSEHWRTARRPGPAPWWPADEIESTRASLTASEWRRLILCEWAESDDALTTAEDVAGCVRPGSAVLEPSPLAGQYVAALDVGTRRDLTALAVGHAEHRDVGRVVVIDRVMSWRPADTGGRVDLSEVEASAARICKEYRAQLRFDRMQAEQLVGNLSRAGIRTDEYVFSAAGANRLARSLYTALRDRAVELPDDSELLAELGSVRMVETQPGTVKMINPPGTHDDVATAVAMVIATLTQKPELGRGHVSIPGLLQREPVHRQLGGVSTATGGRGPKLPVKLAARQAQRRGPRGVNFIVMPGSANDPRRVIRE